MGYKKFLGMGYKKFLGMGYKKFLGPGSSEWVTRIPGTVDIFTGFSCERFLGISADFPQNCYLGYGKSLNGKENHGMVWEII